MPSTTRLENTEAQTPMKARWGAPLGGGSWADRIAMRLQPRKNRVTESFRAEGQLWQLRRHHPDHIALNLPDDNNGTLINPIFRGHFQSYHIANVHSDLERNDHCVNVAFNLDDNNADHNYDRYNIADNVCHELCYNDADDHRNRW